MKHFFIAFIVVAVPAFSFAQLDDEKQQQFELEVEQNQIHDAQGERDAAQKEAVRQEQVEKQRKHQLDMLESQRKLEMGRNQDLINKYRNRITTAEKKIKSYDAEIMKMNAVNQKLKSQADALAAKMKQAEDTANAAKHALDDKYRERNDVIKAMKQSQANTAAAEADIRKMKIDYAKLTMETRNLEGHLKMIQQAEQQRMQQRQEAERSVSSMKQRRDAADDAVRQKQGSR